MDGAFVALSETRRPKLEARTAAALVAIAADHPVRVGAFDVAEARNVHPVGAARGASPWLGLQFRHAAGRSALVNVVHQVAAEHAAGVEIKAVIGGVHHQTGRFER